jgi:methyl-accepting chemotaxis protein
LDDNYKSINAAKKMIEALEREDSGILLLLSAKWKEGRNTIVEAHKNFQNAYATASNNVTVPGEKGYIDKINALYKTYRENWDRPIVGTEYEGNLDWYLTKVHRDFALVKTAVEDLMTLNDNAMYQTASDLKDRAHRAVMPGIVAILTALVFAFIFNFFVNLYVVNPIISMIKSITRFMQSSEPIKLHIDTGDELQDLATSISNLSKLVSPSKLD